MAGDEVILVAGGRGLVGSAIVRALHERGYSRVLAPARAELDLTDAEAVSRYFATHRPRDVYVAAAKVGGILANSTYPADFIRENLLIQTNVIVAAHAVGVRRLLLLGSSCIYPRDAAQPLREDALLTGPLEKTNEAYAIAKLAGITMLRAYRTQYGLDGVTLLPTNLYGPGDNFDLQRSHVLPALLRKMHEAKTSGAREVVVWGSGRPLREFLHVDDLADAALFVMGAEHPPELANVGVGRDLSVLALAELIARIVGFTGEIVFDASKPDGTPRKLLDVSRLSEIGWTPRIRLEDGLRATYAWYQEHLPG